MARDGSLIFFTIHNPSIPSEQNPRSVRIIEQHQMEERISAVHLSSRREYELVTWAKVSVALFDHDFNISHWHPQIVMLRGTPSWAYMATWAVKIGPSAVASQSTIKRCAEQIERMITKEDNSGSHSLPWGQAPSATRKSRSRGDTRARRERFSHVVY